MKLSEFSLMALAIVVLGFVLTTVAKGCTAYSIRNIELNEKAVAQGCSVHNYTIICPQKRD